MTKKTRIDSFDFIRSISAWIIVIYHFAGICNTTPQFAPFPFLYQHANGVWGENTSVNIFFILSGASLYYNHPDLEFKSLKKYYFSRFKGLFPMFYMVWFFMYYQKAVTVNNLFFNGSPKSMILTLFGMDGYLSYRYPQNYYFIGEWFLGALVCLYLLYPLLTWCMKHCKILTTAVLGIGTLLMPRLQPYFHIQRERNLIVCLFAFWLGMIFIEYRELLSSRILAILGGIGALFLLLVKLPVDGFYCIQVIPVGLFLAFYQIGIYIMKVPALNRFFAYTGKISYTIFLLQHVVMSQILGLFSAYSLTPAQEWLLLGVTFGMIYLFSSIVTNLNKLFIQTKLFQKLQQFFC